MKRYFAQTSYWLYVFKIGGLFFVMCNTLSTLSISLFYLISFYRILSSLFSSYFKYFSSGIFMVLALSNVPFYCAPSVIDDWQYECVYVSRWTEKTELLFRDK